MKTWLAQLNGSEFKVCRLNDAPAGNQPVLDQPEAVVTYLRERLPNAVMFRPDTENMIVVHLSTRKKPIGFEIISNGILDTLLIHPREVFRSAILANSAGIVLAHNHPSGDPTPSEGDIKSTRDMIRAGQLLKIEVVDHVILGRADEANGNKGWSSLRELGYFYT